MTPPAACRATTFADLIERRAGDDQRGYISAAPDGTSSRLSFAELARTCWAVAAELGRMDLGQLESARRAVAGEPDGGPQQPSALIACSDPLLFISHFFGALLAGVTPIPIPAAISQHPRHAERVRTVAVASGAGAVLCPPQAEHEVSALLGGLDLPILSLAGRRPASAGPSLPSPRPGKEPPYVQYTSGSVSDPKPIRVTPGHALAHLRQAAQVYEESSDSVSVNWVPLFHDMGLVTSVLRPLYSGYTSVILDPRDFLTDPAFWLSAMSRWQATHTSAPNFGYALSARKAQPRRDWDLSPLRVARVAGELVRSGTLAEFTERFGPAGFTSTAFAPSYGLAEATLTVTTCGVPDEPRLLWADRVALAAGTVIECPAGSETGAVLVSCGRPLPDTEVRIVADTEGGPNAAPALRPLPDGEVGEVWITGPQVVRPEPADVVGQLCGRRTGDLGFLYHGELFLLGRSHERFQVNGENFYGADLEAEVSAASEHVRAGRVVALADETRSSVAIVAEWNPALAPPTQQSMAAAARQIVARLARRFGLTVGTVRFVTAGSIPLTTSGKVRRHGVLSNSLDELWTYRRGEQP